MGVLFTLLIIFMIVLVLILVLPPDGMSDREIFDAKIKQIWCAVNICRTAGFGEPLIRIQSPEGSNLLKVDFIDSDTVIVSLPLIQIEQGESKKDYLAILAKHNLDVSEGIYADNYPVLNVSLNRNDEELGHFITLIYQQLFKARIGDRVILSVWTIMSDMRILKYLFVEKLPINADTKFIAPSAKYNGKPAIYIQAERIITASSVLLFPLIMILSYELYGVTGLCWAALGFYGFFFAYRTFYQKHPLLSTPVWMNLLYFILFATAFIMQSSHILQSILSIMAALMILMNGLQVFNFLEPKLENEIRAKATDPTKFKYQTLMQILVGVLILGSNEWARRSLSLDQWVWFYGLVRFELMLAAIVLFLPIFFIFLKIQNKASDI